MAQVKVLTKRVKAPRRLIGSDATFEDAAATRSGVLKYDVITGASDMTNYHDGDNFYPFDGDSMSYADGKDDSFKNEVFPETDEFSYASADRKARKDARKEKRAARIDAKKAKTEEIRSRAALNKGLTADKQSDVELAKALQEKGGDEAKPGLSKGAMIGIGAGALVLIVVIVLATRRGGKGK